MRYPTSPVVFVLMLLYGASAGADCAAPKPPCDEFGQAVAVFVGRVVNIDPDSRGGTRLTFAIEEPFKGVAHDQVDVIRDGMGDVYFELGRPYFVYARAKAGERLLAVYGC